MNTGTRGPQSPARRRRGWPSPLAARVFTTNWMTSWILRSELTSSRSDTEVEIEGAQYGAGSEEDRPRYGHRAEVTADPWRGALPPVHRSQAGLYICLAGYCEGFH